MVERWKAEAKGGVRRGNGEVERERGREGRDGGKSMFVCLCWRVSATPCISRVNALTKTIWQWPILPKISGRCLVHCVKVAFRSSD